MWDEESLIYSQDSKSTAVTPTHQQPPLTKEDDPFLFYSSDRRRMEHLLGKDLPLPSEEPTIRKTRISFEVDPFFSIMESYPEL
mmetsp:Transcript_14181/g.26955  ORF Transcript_14181/g.26955 Transcript_14181/m.26955 type:complete len:84 (+) Transcript_14181:1-252(+)